jgi:hypothetical protein
MIPYEESAFRFEFGESWSHVQRWDSCTAYTNGVGTVQGTLDARIEGTKALDFVGIRNGELWLFEIKDFRNRPIQLKDRLNELPLEIALKVRDTLAGLVGRHHHDDAEPWVTHSVQAIADNAAMPTVVAVIAQPGGLPAVKRKVYRDVLMKKTRQRLAWLTRRVFLVDPEVPGCVPDVRVVPLSQAKPAKPATQ